MMNLFTRWGTGLSLCFLVTQMQAQTAVCNGGAWPVDISGTATINAGFIDGGSTCPNGCNLYLSPSVFSCMDVGITQTVTLTVEDIVTLQQDFCTANVDILDMDPPTASCLPVGMIFYMPNGGPLTLTGDQLAPSSLDNCTGFGFLNFLVNTQPSITFSTPGTYGSLLVEVADQWSNSASCTAEIVVLDTTANADSLALLQIRESIKTPGNTNALEESVLSAARWVSGNPIQNWYGVTFNGQGRVIDVNLSQLHTLVTIDTNAVRPLPDSLFVGERFRYLVALNLANCAYTAAPSSHWADGTLNTSLNFISLLGNRFGYSGSDIQALVPKVGGDFPALNVLMIIEAFHNPHVNLPSITTVLPINAAQGHRTIYAQIINLDGNGFSGALPPIPSLMPRAGALTLSRNHLSDLDAFGLADSLQVLDISNNDFLDANELTMVLNACPRLRRMQASSFMDVGNAAAISVWDFSALTNSRPFEFIGVDYNALQNPIGGALDLDYFLTEVDTFSERSLSFAFNAFDSLEVSDPATIYTNTYLDLSGNQIHQALPTVFFTKMPQLQELLLNNNQFYGELPQAPSLPFSYSFNLMKRLDLSDNQLTGEVNFEWMLGWATVSDTSQLMDFHIDNNDFTAVKQAVLQYPGFGRKLQRATIENNRFDFYDLAAVAGSLDMHGQVSPTGVWYYAPQNAQDMLPSGLPDTLAFIYHPQDSLGIGGVRHREPGTQVVLAEEIGRFNGAPTKYAWLRYNPAVNIKPELLAYSEAGTAGLTALPMLNPNPLSVPVAALQTETEVFSGIACHRVIDDLNNNALNPGGELNSLSIDTANATYGDMNNWWCYYTVAYNDSFPKITLTTKKKRFIAGACYDNAGQQIQCQYMFVQFNGNYSLRKSNGPVLSESEKTAFRDSLGVKLVKGCPCGDLEMWEISDTTYENYLLSNGKGTRTVATTTHGKPQLLSANSNYRLQTVQIEKLLPTGNASFNTNPSTVRVAIIDSGVDYDHPALENQLLNPSPNPNDTCALNQFGYNFLDTLALPFDDHGHGTLVAGVVAGQASSTEGMVSPDEVNPIAIMPLKFADAQGGGTLFEATCALFTAIENGAQVINASWGYWGDECPGLQDALDYAQSRDIVVVCAAGNSGANNVDILHWPSMYSQDSFGIKNLISVAAIDSANPEILANYSNYSPSIVHLATEGSVLSTDIDTIGNIIQMANAMGTSFAAPKVSRAVALMRYLYPDLTPCEIKEVLRLSVDTLQSNDADSLAWRGRLNFEKALALLDSTSTFANCLTATQPASPTESQTALAVYPNPFGGYLQLQWTNAKPDEQADIRVYGIDGRLRYQLFSNQWQETISTQDWQAGIYVLQVHRGNKVYVEKIVKY